MDFLSLIKAAIKLFPKPPSHTKEEKKIRERRIVSRYAQGNTSLQMGKYITGEEIELRKASLSLHSF